MLEGNDMNTNIQPILELVIASTPLGHRAKRLRQAEGLKRKKEQKVPALH